MSAQEDKFERILEGTTKRFLQAINELQNKPGLPDEALFKVMNGLCSQTTKLMKILQGRGYTSDEIFKKVEEL